MKYKLKRDLPFAKAGSVILYSENRKEFDGSLGSVSDMMSVETNKGYLSQWVEIGAKDNLLSEGWIEEVKPREYYIYDCPECVTAYREQWESGSLIKVREVME